MFSELNIIIQSLFKVCLLYLNINVNLNLLAITSHENSKTGLIASAYERTNCGVF